MIFLCLSIVLSSLLVCGIRVSVNKGISPLGLNTSYRLTGGIFIIILFIVSMLSGDFDDSWEYLVFLGIIAAFLYWLSGYATIKAIHLGHLGISSTVVRCSMLLPTLASIVYWREISLTNMDLKTVLTLSGFFFIFTSMLLIGLEHKQSQNKKTTKTGIIRKKQWIFWLVAAFFSTGFWDICLRSTKNSGNHCMYLLFMSVVVSGAALMTFPLFISRKQIPFRLGKKEMLAGLALGIFATSATLTKMYALSELDGIMVFPLTTVSIILLTQIASCKIFKEKIGRSGTYGIILAILGIFLLAF